MKKYQSVASKFLTTALLVTFCCIAQAAEVGEGALPYYDSAAFSPKWLKPNSLELADFHKISEFSFMDQHGKLVTHDTFADKIYVASFFFTTCPGICPKMRSQLSKVQDKFIGDDKVAIISHSIRPGNDTVKVLQQYAQQNDIVSGKWHLVTGKREDIYAIAREDYFANEDLGKFVEEQDFLHTENLVLVDSNRHIRGIYNGLNNTSVNHLLNDIETLQQELVNTL
jgi:protein SCO1/2